VILFVAVIFLLLIGIGAYMAAQSALLSEKVASNQWELERAAQAAEAGALDGASWLFKLATANPPEGSGTGDAGIWAQGTMLANLYDPGYDWGEGVVYGTQTGASGAPFATSYGPPRYLVENIGWVRDDLSPENASAGNITFYYSVSGHGYGSGSGARATVQKVVAKRFH